MIHAKVTQINGAYVLRTFLNYLYEQKVTLVDNSIFVPCVTGNLRGQIPSFYTSYELTFILAAVDRANAVGKRDYAILLFAIRYGMRTGDDSNMPTTKIGEKKITMKVISLLNLMIICILASSKIEARRLIQQGGASVNAEKVNNVV